MECKEEKIKHYSFQRACRFLVEIDTNFGLVDASLICRATLPSLVSPILGFDSKYLDEIMKPVEITYFMVNGSSVFRRIIQSFTGLSGSSLKEDCTLKSVKYLLLNAESKEIENYLLIDPVLERITFSTVLQESKEIMTGTLHIRYSRAEFNCID